VKNVKLNPYIRSFDSIRDEKLDVFFDKNSWIEVKESDWNRLKDAETKQGDIILPTFISKEDGMGDVKNLVQDTKKEEVDSSDEDWFGTDAIVEEE